MGISVYPLHGKRLNQHYNGRLWLFTKRWVAAGLKNSLSQTCCTLLLCITVKHPNPKPFMTKCNSINYHKVGLVHCMKHSIERLWKVFNFGGPILSICVSKNEHININWPLDVKPSHITRSFSQTSSEFFTLPLIDDFCCTCRCRSTSTFISLSMLCLCYSQYLIQALVSHNFSDELKELFHNMVNSTFLSVLKLNKRRCHSVVSEVNMELPDSR